MSYWMKPQHIMLVALTGMLGGVSLAQGVTQPGTSNAAPEAPVELLEPIHECFEDRSCLSLVPGYPPVFWTLPEMPIENTDFWRT